MVLQDGRQTFTLVGIIGFGENDSLLGATMAGFDLTTAQRLFDKVGLVDEVDVQAEPGVSAGELRDRIAAILPDDVEALTGDQVAADGSAAVRDAMGVFTTVLLVFAGISVLVGSFVIWNTFNVLVAQRRREVALLRAVGATRRQVLGGVLLEATLVGTFSAGSGSVARRRSGCGHPLPVDADRRGDADDLTGRRDADGRCCPARGRFSSPWWLPSRRPGRRPGSRRWRRCATPCRRATPSGGVGRSAGWILLPPARPPSPAALSWATSGGGRCWPPWSRSQASSSPDPRSLAPRRASRTTAGAGAAWRMAARNIERNARRSAATALALTIGLTVVVAVAVSAASLRESVADAVSGGNRSDLILEPAGAGLGVSPSVADLLRDRDDVTDVVELRETGARVDGHDSLVSAMNAEGLDRVIDLGIEDGSLDAFGPGTILVSTEQAERLGVGDGRRRHRDVRGDGSDDHAHRRNLQSGFADQRLVRLGPARLRRQRHLPARRRDPGQQRPRRGP